MMETLPLLREAVESSQALSHRQETLNQHKHNIKKQHMLLRMASIVKLVRL